MKRRFSGNALQRVVSAFRACCSRAWERKRSPQVAPVSESSGATATDAPCACAAQASDRSACALACGWASCRFGVSAATRINPVIRITSIIRVEPRFKSVLPHSIAHFQSVQTGLGSGGFAPLQEVGGNVYHLARVCGAESRLNMGEVAARSRPDCGRTWAKWVREHGRLSRSRWSRAAGRRMGPSEKTDASARFFSVGMVAFREGLQRSLRLSGKAPDGKDFVCPQ